MSWPDQAPAFVRLDPAAEAEAGRTPSHSNFILAALRSKPQIFPTAPVEPEPSAPVPDDSSARIAVLEDAVLALMEKAR